MSLPVVLIAQALRSVLDDYHLSETLSWQLDKPRIAKHGDYASNAAMVLAASLHRTPRELAQELVRDLKPKLEQVCSEISIAGAGFINFHIADAAWQHAASVYALRRSTRALKTHKAERILVEFVSTNPTGPLHAGHGRGAAQGDAMARLLTEQGHQVQKEYYVNDAGRQIDILTLSVWLRYLALHGPLQSFPQRGYQGGFIEQLAQGLKAHAADSFVAEALEPSVHTDGEQELDDFIVRMKACISARDYAELKQQVVEPVLDRIRQDLAAFRVQMDEWFFESRLHAQAKPQAIIERLRQHKLTYESEGALWFASSKLGDRKDRVLKRSNGEWTYFAADIAYHVDKLERGHTRLVNVWGADHHGYIERMRAALKGLGYDPECLQLCIVQMVDLRDEQGERQKMSTRSGQYMPLLDLIEDIGADPCRFFYCQRPSNQHFVLDLKLARQSSMENPVHYIQYAHARLCSVLKASSPSAAQPKWQSMVQPSERSLLRLLLEFDEAVDKACEALEPCVMAHYLRDLAQAVHVFYNQCPINGAEEPLKTMRLALVDWAKHALAKGLGLLAVEAPERM